MAELTIDEKIERLVRSVLEAVDQRLDDVRAEVARVAADAEATHRQVLSMLAEHDYPAAAAPIDTTAIDERVAHLERTIEELRAELAARPLHAIAPAPILRPADPAPPPREPVGEVAVTADPGELQVAPVPDSLRDLSRVTAPLLPNSPSGQVPIVGTNEPIDVGRLSSLLTERLGHLQLELRAEP